MGKGCVMRKKNINDYSRGYSWERKEKKMKEEKSCSGPNKIDGIKRSRFKRIKEWAWNRPGADSNGAQNPQISGWHQMMINNIYIKPEKIVIQPLRLYQK